MNGYDPPKIFFFTSPQHARSQQSTNTHLSAKRGLVYAQETHSIIRQELWERSEVPMGLWKPEQFRLKNRMSSLDQEEQLSAGHDHSKVLSPIDTCDKPNWEIEQSIALSEREWW